MSGTWDWPPGSAPVLWDACASPLLLVDRTGAVRCVNRAFTALTGRAPSDVLTYPVWELLPVDVGVAALSVIEPWASARHVTAPEQLVVDADGTEHRLTWLLTRLTLGPSAEPHLLVTGVDVTSERQAQARLRDQAERDPLTGVANRRSALRALQRVLADASGAGAFVLYCDLDDFKQVNDEHGHLAGDHVLKVVAMRLSAAVGPTNLVARLGGDEFVALVTDPGGPEPSGLVAGVRAAVGAPIPWGDGVVVPGISVGVALARPGDDPDAALHAADADMYRVKYGNRPGAGTVPVSRVGGRRRAAGR